MTADIRDSQPASRRPGPERRSFDWRLTGVAALDSLRKLNPRVQLRNPVMFVVWVGALLTFVLFIQAVAGPGEASPGFILAISLLLWFTVIFANFAEALAEGRGKAQADSLRKARKEIVATRLADARRDAPAGSRSPRRCSRGATSCWSRRVSSSPPTARW